VSELTVAIVGSGVIGQHHAEAIARHPRLRIVAVVDPVLDARLRLAASCAAEHFATLAAALSQGGIDLVVVCTPSGTHAAVAEEALAAGTHVVVEKPLDTSLDRARRLADLAIAAEARGQLCSVISQHRFDPASAAVAEAVASGRFGRLTSAVASLPWWRGQDYYDSADWRGTWEFDGGGAAMNQGIHLVDLLLWLFGRPVDVYAHTGLLAHGGIEVEDVAVATIRFGSGALAVLHATTAAYPGLPVRLQVHGSQGSAVIEDFRLEYLHTLDGATCVPEPEPEDAFALGHLRQYHDIVDAIESGRPPLVTVGEALQAMALVKAMYVSSVEGRPVAVEELLT
jgi:predicted dehydrogenase